VDAVITDTFFSWFTAQVHALLMTLPRFPATLPSFSFVGTIWQYAGWANEYVPLDAAVSLFGFVLVAWGVLYGWKFAEWCLTKAHILGGSS
jgi:hypothetical protein